MPESVENLEIWQEGMALARAVYKLTRSWPSEETYGMTSQARRAVVSVPTNIAEGVGRGGSREVARFAQIALGSLYELDTTLRLASDMGYLPHEELEKLGSRIASLAKRISSFIRYQKGQTTGADSRRAEG